MMGDMDQDCMERLSKAIRAYYAGDQESPDWMDDESYEELVAESGISGFDLEELKRSSVTLVDKVRHRWPMGTLDKVHDMSELPDATGYRVYQLKYDGCSIEVHFDANGVMDYACTRGDYTYGENRTELARCLMSYGIIDPNLSVYHECSVRGELLVSNDDWPALSGTYSNQRNAASGIANRDDLSLARFLTFVPYDVVGDADGTVSMVGAAFDVGTPPVFSDMESATDAFERADVPVDGVVVKDYEDDSCTRQTSAVAYKFSDRTYETKVVDVVWQRGRTGKLTPIAVFSPVFIDAEVSRASLGSYRRFEELDLHVGDVISVRRANQVIPYVESNAGGGGAAIHAPSWWNGERTYVDGANLFVKVDARWMDRLLSQVNTLAGKGVSDAFVKDVVNAYGVTTLCELYATVMDDSFSIPGYADKRKAKVRGALSGISRCSLQDFITAMAIDHLGPKTVDKIVDKASFLADESNCSAAEYITRLGSPYEFAYAISGMGEVASKSFADAHSDIVEQLNEFRRTFGEYPGATRTTESGAKVVVTGRFDGLTRRDVEDELTANGFSIADRVSPSTRFLFAGKGGGSKRDAAKSLGVTIIETDGDLNSGLNLIKESERKGA